MYTDALEVVGLKWLCEELTTHC